MPDTPDAKKADQRTAKQIGVFFKKARVDMGVTQRDAAEAAAITLAQIKQYEAGTIMPRLTTALRLCNFYDLSWAELETVILTNSTVKEDDSLNGNPPNEIPNSVLKRGNTLAKTSPPSSPRLKLSRPETRAFGRHIVIDSLTKKGWDIIETNASGTNRSNYDVKAEKDGRVVRLKVTTKQHPTKTTLSVVWKPDEPTFNRNLDGEPADYLVMVRFMGTQDHECFVLPIEEAEEKADWFAEEAIKLGNVPMYLQPYTGGPRNSRFEFNVREVWEPYSEAWELLTK